MTLEDYDKSIKPHLNFIRSGAEMAARHARALTAKPQFATLAELELAETRETLEAALKLVDAAQSQYRGKPMEQTHVA